MHQKIKLQTKVIIFLIIIITAVSLSSLIIFSSQFKKHKIDHIVDWGEYIASNLVLSAIDPLFKENYQNLDEIVAANTVVPDVQSILILDVNERVVSSSNASDVGLIREHIQDDSYVVSGHEIHIIRTIEFYGEKLGHIYLILSTIRIDERYIHVLITWLSVELFILMAAVFLAIFLVRKFLEPLKKILYMTDSISKGEFTGRVDDINNYELDMIANALNTMAEAILEREDNNRSISKEKTELNDYLNNIMNSLSMVILGLDGKGCIIHWNDKVSALISTPSGGLYNRKLTDLMVKPIISDEMILRVIHEKRKEVIQGIGLETDGKHHYFDVVILPLQSDSNYGAVVLIEDVSEIKKYQEVLIQSEKMLSIGGLAAGMAHEIKNPLAGILQNAQTLERRLDFITPSCDKALKKYNLDIEQVKLLFNERKIYKFIRNIHDSGLRISVIIQDMLNYARKSDNSFSTANINDLIEKTINLAINDNKGNVSAHFSDIVLERDYCDQVLEVFCDPNKLIQVFLNILKNGAEAMFETDRDSVFILRTDQKDNLAVIEIEDNGPGIARDKIDHIFDPFFTTKKEGSGTGLGMSISYFIIVDHHKGKLEVKTDGSSWTKFIISLPFS